MAETLLGGEFDGDWDRWAAELIAAGIRGEKEHQPRIGKPVGPEHPADPEGPLTHPTTPEKPEELPAEGPHEHPKDAMPYGSNDEPDTEHFRQPSPE